MQKADLCTADLKENGIIVQLK